MAVLEDLLAVLDKRVKQFKDWGDFWEYDDVPEVLDCYEKHRIIVAKGLTRKRLPNGCLSDLDNFWSYTGEDYLESLEIARKVFSSIKKCNGILVEISGINS